VREHKIVCFASSRLFFFFNSLFSDGTFAPGVVYVPANNTNTQAIIDYYWWDRPYNLNQFYSEATRGQFQLNPDLNRDGVRDYASVTLTPADLAAYDCASIRSAANAQVMSVTGPVSLYNQVVYVGPTGWICGSGLGSIGGSSSGWVCMTNGASTNTMIHEFGHNIGFQHSNAMLLSGAVEEYRRNTKFVLFFFSCFCPKGTATQVVKWFVQRKIFLLYRSIFLNKKK
jgi:hypothetical protein